MGQIAWPVDMEVQGRGRLAEHIGFAMAVDSDASEGERLATMRMLESHHAWRGGGRAVYEVSAPLTAAFAETAFPLTVSDVRLPHPVFFVHVPDSGLTVSNGLENLPANGCYVRVDERGILDMTVVSDIGDMAIFHAQAPMDTEIEAWLAERMDRNSSFVGEYNASQLVSWVRVVVGLCAYLATESPDTVREPYEQRRAHRDAAGANKGRLKDINVSYVRVGTRETALGEFFSADAETRKLTRRHVVRGHYRRLASGKTTWVRPFWRGPEWGSIAKAHIRKVE